jgi:NAD(P)-dependent dehydrogenase (short-subunit alcohol dehydrogenase family)
MKTAIITGSAGGIGKAICKLFLHEGYRVLGVDLIRVKKPAYDFIQYDISELCNKNSSSEDFYRKVEQIIGKKLDVLVNNAALQIVKPAEKLTIEDWNRTLNTNLLAPFLLTKRFLPTLRKAKGSVVNIASIHAQLTKANFAAYSTSKGALVSLTRALALDLAPEVRVNAILPAATDTQMLRDGFKDNKKGLKVLGDYHPLKRIAMPAEIAQVVLFLTSQSGSFITGTALNVDGGIGMCLHDPAE